MHFNDDDDNSSLSDNDVMCLNNCPHCNKLFQDQHVWNQFNRERHIKSHLTIAKKNRQKKPFYSNQQEIVQK